MDSSESLDPEAIQNTLEKAEYLQEQFFKIIAQVREIKKKVEKKKTHKDLSPTQQTQPILFPHHIKQNGIYSSSRITIQDQEVERNLQDDGDYKPIVFPSLRRLNDESQQNSKSQLDESQKLRNKVSFPKVQMTVERSPSKHKLSFPRVQEEFQVDTNQSMFDSVLRQSNLEEKQETDDKIYLSQTKQPSQYLKINYSSQTLKDLNNQDDVFIQRISPVDPKYAQASQSPEPQIQVANTLSDIVQSHEIQPEQHQVIQDPQPKVTQDVNHQTDSEPQIIGYETVQQPQPFNLRDDYSEKEPVQPEVKSPPNTCPTPQTFTSPPQQNSPVITPKANTVQDSQIYESQMAYQINQQPPIKKVQSPRLDPTSLNFTQIKFIEKPVQELDPKEQYFVLNGKIGQIKQLGQVQSRATSQARNRGNLLEPILNRPSVQRSNAIAFKRKGHSVQPIQQKSTTQRFRQNKIESQNSTVQSIKPDYDIDEADKQVRTLLMEFEEQNESGSNRAYQTLHKIRLNHPLFNKLSLNGFKFLMENSLMFKLKPGQYVYRQGIAAAPNIYMIMYGKFVCQHNKFGQFGSTMCTGHTLGEESYLRTQVKRTENLTSLDNSCVIQIPLQILQSMKQHHLRAVSKDFESINHILTNHFNQKNEWRTRLNVSDSQFRKPRSYFNR